MMNNPNKIFPPDDLSAKNFPATARLIRFSASNAIIIAIKIFSARPGKKIPAPPRFCCQATI
jgi:hypothetical protein